MGIAPELEAETERLEVIIISYKKLLADADEVCFYYSNQETTKRLLDKKRLPQSEYDRLDVLEQEAISRYLKRKG